MPPPRKSLVFPLTVLLVRLTEPAKVLMPPPRLPLVFPLIVLSVSVTVPKSA